MWSMLQICPRSCLLLLLFKISCRRNSTTCIQPLPTGRSAHTAQEAKKWSLQIGPIWSNHFFASWAVWGLRPVRQWLPARCRVTSPTDFYEKEEETRPRTNLHTSDNSRVNSVVLYNSREWKYHHSVVLYNSPEWKVLPLSCVV